MTASERPPVDPCDHSSESHYRACLDCEEVDGPCALASPAAPPEGLDVIRAALWRLDAIARVDPRNALGEAEFADALAQSFTALHPKVNPVWKPARLSDTGERP